MEKERKERKKKREINENKMRTNIKAIAQAKAAYYVMLSPKENAFGLNSRKDTR